MSKAADRPRVEIARSYSFKMNIGNYQSIDLFCSQKQECYADEAEEVGEKLYQFCRAQVIKAMREEKKILSENHGYPG